MTASRFDWIAAAHLLDGLEGAAAGEHRHPREEPLLGIAEKVVGPIDGRAQSRVALDGPPASAGEHVKSAIEPRDQFGRAHRDDAGGGQLDGQRDAVKALADLYDGSGRCWVVKAKSALTWRARSTNRLMASVCRSELDVVVWITHFQWRKRDQLFAVDRHTLPARGKHHDGRALPFDPATSRATGPSRCSQLSSTNSS